MPLPGASYLFLVDFNNCPVAYGFRNFVGSSFECASLLACFDGDNDLSFDIFNLGLLLESLICIDLLGWSGSLCWCCLLLCG